MQVIENATEDKLIDSLSYKLDATASYITARDSATFWASGSNQYSPTGVRVMNLTLNNTDSLFALFKTDGKPRSLLYTHKQTQQF